MENMQKKPHSTYKIHMSIYIKCLLSNKMKKTNIVFSFRHFFSLSFTVHSLSWHRCYCWYIQIFSHKITPQHLSTHTDIKKFTKPFIFHSLIQFTINQFSFLALISFSLSPSSLHSSHSLSPSPDNQRDASFLRAHQIWSSSFWFLLSGQEDVDSIFLPMSSSSSWPLTSAMVAVGRGKPFLHILCPIPLMTCIGLP